MSTRTPKAPAKPAEQPIAGEYATSPGAGREMLLVSIADLVDDTDNHRLASKDDEPKIAELMRSMATSGLQQPVLLYRDIGGARFHRIFGFRRITAARRLGWTEIPAQILNHVPSPDECEGLRAIENLHRKNLNHAEEALAVLKVYEACGGDVMRTAAEVGMGETWVRDRLYLQRLTDKNRELLAAGVINLGQARELVTIGDASRQNFWGSELKRYVGSGQVIHVERLRGWLGHERHSLRVVGWELAAEFAGKPSCLGCPSNTASDRTLFGTEAASDHGYCMNPGCYDAKVRAVGAANQKTVEKIAAQVKAKKIDKDDAASMAVVTEISPEFVKDSTAQRFVAAKVGPAKKKPGAAAVKAEPAKPKDPKAEARDKWAEAMEDWRQRTMAKIYTSGIEKKGGLNRLLALVLPQIGCFENCEYEAGPNADDPVRTPPTLAKLLTAGLSFNGIEALLEAMADGWCNFPQDFQSFCDREFTPDVVQRLAKAFGVECGEPPELAEFLKAAQPAKEKPSKKADGARASGAGAGVPVDTTGPWLRPGAFVRIIDNHSAWKGEFGEVKEPGRVTLTGLINVKPLSHDVEPLEYMPRDLQPPVTKAEEAELVVAIQASPWYGSK